MLIGLRPRRCGLRLFLALQHRNSQTCQQHILVMCLYMCSLAMVGSANYLYDHVHKAAAQSVPKHICFAGLQPFARRSVGKALRSKFSGSSAYIPQQCKQLSISCDCLNSCPNDVCHDFVVCYQLSGCPSGLTTASEAHALRLQIVQKIPGRQNQDEPGEGHCDKVISVSCHPDRKLMASGSLSGDTSVKIWEDEN